METVFQRIQRKNEALWRMLDSSLPHEERLSSLEEAFNRDEKTMKVVKGGYYTSAHWLNPEDNQPLRCKVTRIAQGNVYYRPHYGWHEDGTEWFGAPSYFPIESAAKYFSGDTVPYPH